MVMVVHIHITARAHCALAESFVFDFVSNYELAQFALFSCNLFYANAKIIGLASTAARK